MKSALVVLLAVCISFVEIKADVRRDCRRQTNVSWASLKRLKAGNFEQNDPQLHCYMRCFMMKNGILGENDVVEVEKAVRHMPRSMQDSSRTILNRCKSVSGSNSCEKAFRIARCYVKSQPEILKNVPFV